MDLCAAGHVRSSEPILDAQHRESDAERDDQGDQRTRYGRVSALDRSTRSNADDEPDETEHQAYERPELVEIFLRQHKRLKLWA